MEVKVGVLDRTFPIIRSPPGICIFENGRHIDEGLMKVKWQIRLGEDSGNRRVPST